jgi:hypothetical protein
MLVPMFVDFDALGVCGALMGYLPELEVHVRAGLFCSRTRGG